MERHSICVGSTIYLSEKMLLHSTEKKESNSERRAETDTKKSLIDSAKDPLGVGFDCSNSSKVSVSFRCRNCLVF